MNGYLRQGIYNLGLQVTGLSSSNFFFEEMKQSASKPYCVFSPITSPLDFDSGAEFENEYVQFSFFADEAGSNLSSLETIVEAFKNVFDFGEKFLGVQNFKVISCIREFVRGPVKVDRVWQVDIQYKIIISKLRS
jgi:hypothetical protein